MVSLVKASAEAPSWIDPEKSPVWLAQERQKRRQAFAEQVAIAFVRSGRDATTEEITDFSRDLAERLISAPKLAD